MDIYFAVGKISYIYHDMIPHSFSIHFSSNLKETYENIKVILEMEYYLFSGLGSSVVFSFNLLTWLSTSPKPFIQTHRNCFIYFRNLEIASNWQQQTHRGLLLIVFTNLPVGDRSLKALIMFAPIVQLLNCCRLLIISLLQLQICVIHIYFRFMGLRRS